MIKIIVFVSLPHVHAYYDDGGYIGQPMVKILDDILQVNYG